MVGTATAPTSMLDRLAALTPRLVSGAMASERTLAVHPSLTALFPQGLSRGSTVRCHGHAATSMATLLAAGAVEAGAWMGVAAAPTLGVQACREAGVCVERMVAVREPAGGAFDDAMWGQVLATLIDGFDIVVFGAAARVRAGTARRLQARLQHRGAVVVLVGEAGSFSCDQQLASVAQWQGLGEGHGHLRSRQVHLTLEGRRMQRPRRDALWYPGPSGVIEQVTVPAPVPATVPAPVPAPVPATDVGSGPVPLRHAG